MKFNHYKFKFYINANHAIYLRGVLGQNHPHTWEISLDTIKVSNDFVQFDYIEKTVERYLLKFQDADINKIEPFTVTNPTLENLCEFFKNSLGDILSNNGWLLARIEISETPTRSYILDLSDEIDRLASSETESDESEKTIENAAAEKINSILGYTR